MNRFLKALSVVLWAAFLVFVILIPNTFWIDISLFLAAIFVTKLTE